jgi:hypothetical protein
MSPYLPRDWYVSLQDDEEQAEQEYESYRDRQEWLARETQPGA